MLVSRQDDIGPDLVRDHHAIVLAIDVHGVLDLIALPYAAAGIVRRAEYRGMDVVLGELALHVLKVQQVLFPLFLRQLFGVIQTGDLQTKG